MGFLPKMLTGMFNAKAAPFVAPDHPLKNIIDMIAAVPEGKELLDLARQKDYRFSLNPQLDAQAKHTPGDRHIELRGNASPRDMAVSLAHELRHVWHYERLEMSWRTRGRMSPLASVVFSRALEGDAHAFEEFFSRKLDGRPDMTREEWAQAFNGYQDSAVSRANYDPYNAGNASQDMTNAVSLKELAEKFDLRRIMVAGMREKPYHDAADGRALAAALRDRVDPGLLPRLQAFENRAPAAPRNG